MTFIITKVKILMLTKGDISCNPFAHWILDIDGLEVSSHVDKHKPPSFTFWCLLECRGWWTLVARLPCVH
jgi:hypothetical protein